MSTIHTASHQWASRPNDERFLSLDAMLTHKRSLREASVSKIISTRQIEARPIEGDLSALALIGPNGGEVTPTHWAFSQLASQASAPAGYLRSLPAPIAADCINYGLRFANTAKDVGVLLRKPSGEAATISAITGPNYGRVWDDTIIEATIRRFGDGVTGPFRIPGIFGQAVVPTIDNTTLYASDRDMFIFLADEINRVEIPDRRNGQPGQLARGFFVWNSEVGSQTFGVATFLFDYVCSNRIVWGAQGYQEIRIRHTSSAPFRWIEEVAPAIEAYSKSSTNGITSLIAEAKAKPLGTNDAVFEFLAKRFNKSQASAIQGAHLVDEDRPIETLWDAVTGITAYARSIQHQDTRVSLEREAGKVLNLAA